ncbi:MAG: cobalamin-dependent protein, partial [Lachnospiraceae bacterium]|nr:cobalamin-dependent protein [Lachnospiraceae bacterium]
MNYLFVMPRFRQNKNDTYMFPLGMAYVSASLKQVRTQVFCLNLNMNFREIEEEVRDAICKYDVDVIATGGLTPNFKQVRTIISAAKRFKPEIITMAGGGLLTATPEVIMRGIPELDIGMIAEGEITIRELAETLENGKDLGQVKGIVYRTIDQTVVRTEEREDIQDLDALPFPDYEGFEFDGKNSVSICTSRSCPFGCS